MKKQTHFVAWTLALYPWLSNYATFVNGMSIGDLLLIIDVVYGLFIYSTYKQGIRSCAHVGYFGVFLLYSFFSISLLVILSNHTVNNAMVIKRFIKFSLFIVAILMGTNGLSDKEAFAKALTIMGRACCIALVVQYLVFYTTSHYVEFKIPLLKYSNDVVESIDKEASQLVRFRPSSVFFEPAHFTYYMAGYTAFVLFYRNRKSKINRILEAMLTTICTVASVSSTALVVSGIIWGTYVVQLVVNHTEEFKVRYRILILIVVVISFAVGIRYYLNSPELSYSLRRMLYSENETLATSVWGRLDSGKYYVERLQGIYKVFGMGLGNLPSVSSYFNSNYYVLYCTGYVGAGILLAWAAHVFFSGKIMGKVALVLLLALCFSSPIIISGYLIEYLMIIDLDSTPTEPSICIGEK